jgi:hypothetical protein
VSVLAGAPAEIGDEMIGAHHDRPGRKHESVSTHPCADGWFQNLRGSSALLCRAAAARSARQQRLGPRGSRNGGPANQPSGNPLPLFFFSFFFLAAKLSDPSNALCVNNNAAGACLRMPLFLRVIYQRRARQFVRSYCTPDTVLERSKTMQPRSTCNVDQRNQTVNNVVDPHTQQSVHSTVPFHQTWKNRAKIDVLKQTNGRAYSFGTTVTKIASWNIWA